MALVAASGCGGLDYAEDAYACTPGEPGNCPPGMVCRWSEAGGGEHQCFGDAGQPEITGLEGTGPAQAVAPHPEDQAAFDNATDMVVASHPEDQAALDNATDMVVAGPRIDSDAPELVASGTGREGRERR